MYLPRILRPNRAAREDAIKIREAFQDEEWSRETPMRWDWPRSMVEVGSCEAVMYTSNKWQKNPRDLIDYKHLAEAPQWLLCEPGFIREYRNPNRKLKVVGPRVELRHMPDSFAVLAKLLGVQTQLYEGSSRDYYLPRDRDENLYQINIAGAKLGGAVHPNGQKFLLIYTAAGVHAIVTGDHLDIKKDGIVG